jgi:crossover junction endodeoxyribonuclease RuvC
VRILGIDPGFGILGWSVIESDLTLIDYGTIETSSMMPFDERIYLIHGALKKIIAEYAPEFASIEKIFFQKNTTTAMDVAKAMGAVLLTLRMCNVGYQEYTPSQVKQAITGYGRAPKEQMQQMIKKIFSIKETPRPDDAADALAIAACHCFRLDVGAREQVPHNAFPAAGK